MFKTFPLLAVVVIIYNFFSFTAGDAGIDPETGVAVTGMVAMLDKSVFSVSMVSQAEWVLSRGDLLVILGLIFLFFEVIRSTRSDATAIVNHGMSMAVLAVCFIEFLTLANFATSTFFFLTVMTLLDVVAGFTISITSARRDFGAFPGA